MQKGQIKQLRQAYIEHCFSFWTFGSLLPQLSIQQR